MYQSVEIEKEQVTIPLGSQAILGTIHRPICEKKSPAVLFIHGFASNRSGKFRLSYDLSEKLAAEGFTVLRIDLRGCGDSDGSFEEMSISSQIEDCQAALQWLANDDGIDASRIGILGRSMGAAIALKSVGQVKSLALWVPFFDATQWMHQFGSLPKNQPILIGGNSPGPQFFKEIASFSVADMLASLKDVPIFQVHAKKDQKLDASHMKNYLDARAGLNERDRTLILEEADHSFSRPQDRKVVMEETVRWFKETLI